MNIGATEVLCLIVAAGIVLFGIGPEGPEGPV